MNDNPVLAAQIEALKTNYLDLLAVRIGVIALACVMDDVSVANVDAVMRISWPSPNMTLTHKVSTQNRFAGHDVSPYLTNDCHM